MSPISRQAWFFKFNFYFSNSQNTGKCKLGWFSFRQIIKYMYVYSNIANYSNSNCFKTLQHMNLAKHMIVYLAS